MLQISALYDEKHARDVPAEKNFSESNFVRKSLKFWVRLPVRFAACRRELTRRRILLR